MFAGRCLRRSHSHLAHAGCARWPVGRRFIAKFAAPLLLLLGVAGLAIAGDEPAMRIGLTPVFLNDQTSFLQDWETYLEERLQTPVKFVRRKSYREITEMVLDDRLDVAWICGFPYVRHQQRVNLLAVPLFEGEPLYQSYLIVPAQDRDTSSIADLRGKIFAYSDPDSNSGYLVPQTELRKADIDPTRFFAKTFFTWAHRDVVSAVANGVAQAGAVDGYVWETLRQIEPELTARTRVVRKSEKFGFPPIVARESLPPDHFQAFQKVLLDMPQDPAGRQLLRKLNLDGFTSGERQLFDDIQQAMLFVEGG